MGVAQQLVALSRLQSASLIFSGGRLLQVRSALSGSGLVNSQKQQSIIQQYHQSTRQGDIYCNSFNFIAFVSVKGARECFQPSIAFASVKGPRKCFQPSTVLCNDSTVSGQSHYLDATLITVALRRLLFRRSVHGNGNGPQHEESWGQFLNKNYRTAQLVFTFVATYTAGVLTVGNLMIQPIKDSLQALEKSQNQSMKKLEESQNQSMQKLEVSQNQSMQKLEESQRHQSQDLRNLLQTLSDDMKARDQRLSDKIDQVSGRVSHLEGQIGVVIEIARGSADLTK